MLCVTWNIGGKSVWKRSSFKSLLSCRKKYNWADREPSTERKTQLSTESRSNKGRIIVSDFSFTISLTLNSHRHFNVSERKIIEKRERKNGENQHNLVQKEFRFLIFSLPHRRTCVDACGIQFRAPKRALCSHTHTRYEGFETNVLYRWGKTYQKT